VQVAVAEQRAIGACERARDEDVEDPLARGVDGDTCQDRDHEDGRAPARPPV